jgi:trimethylamine--corrinoid protein Co-methyltransferase
VRPRLTILSEKDIDKIIDGAMAILEKVGMHVGSKRVLDLVGSQNGAGVRGDRVTMSRDLVERSLKTVPSVVRVYRQSDPDAIVLEGDRVHFVAGSVAPYIYDESIKGLREPTSSDLTNHIKVLNHCPFIDFQSGSYVVKDVPKQITSSYRYYLSLLYSPKPIFGGAFGTKDLSVIREMLAVVAGGNAELKEMPNAVIAVNPSSPLSLTEIVAENLSYCAEYMLPAMLIPIPLAGGSSPVTLAGTLCQHTAENLGSIVVSQTVRPGAPLIFGGGPSIMDMRKGTASQAATEAVIMGASIGQIAKRLKMPSATNTGRADSKRVDYQAGEETGVGLTLMALAGLNMIRGSGTLEYANVVSIEKLILDNELCGMAKRMVRPMDTSAEGLAVELIQGRATSTDGYLSDSHTFDWFRTELFQPSSLIDRGSRREYEEEGSRDAYGRALAKVGEILKNYKPRAFDLRKKEELNRIIRAHAKQFGVDQLPIMDIH